MKLEEMKQIAKQLDPIALTEERDRYKALYEYWKSRAEAAENYIDVLLDNFQYTERTDHKSLKTVADIHEEIKNAEPSCDAMGHFGGHPKPEGECPKCGKKW